jgi:hypothetical protein
MSIQERLKEAYERTRSSGPAEVGAYGRFQRRRARSVRTVTAATILVLALAGLAPRLLAGQDRGVVHPPRPVPAAPKLIARLAADGPGGRALAFSADGKTLAVAGDHLITLWDLDRQAVTARLDEGDQVGAVAFAPDGRTLAASAYDRVVLWDLASRRQRASLPMGTFNVAGRLAFSPDGRVLAAGDGGGKLILWDATRRTRLAILSSGIGSINDLAFRADGRSVVVGGMVPTTAAPVWGLRSLTSPGAAASQRCCCVLARGRTPPWRSGLTGRPWPRSAASNTASSCGTSPAAGVWRPWRRGRRSLASCSAAAAVCSRRPVRAAGSPSGTSADAHLSRRCSRLRRSSTQGGSSSSRHGPGPSPTTAGGSRSPTAPAASSYGARRFPSGLRVGLTGHETDGPRAAHRRLAGRP